MFAGFPNQSLLVTMGYGNICYISRKVLLAKKVKNISGMEWNSFVCFTVDEKTVESRRNNNGKGKAERDVSFCCAFCRSYFAFHLGLRL